MQDKTLSKKKKKLAYHIGLLVESDLIRAKEHKFSNDPTQYLINTITSTDKIY